MIVVSLVEQLAFWLRYGGSTSASVPWPKGASKQGATEDERLEAAMRKFQKAVSGEKSLGDFGSTLDLFWICFTCI